MLGFMAKNGQDSKRTLRTAETKGWLASVCNWPADISLTSERFGWTIPLYPEHAAWQSLFSEKLQETAAVERSGA